MLYWSCTLGAGSLSPQLPCPPSLINDHIVQLGYDGVNNIDITILMTSHFAPTADVDTHPADCNQARCDCQHRPLMTSMAHARQACYMRSLIENLRI